MNSTLKTNAPPVDPAGLRAPWERLGAPGRLVLAVSGGSDSMALMRLAAPLRDRADIQVATVDHGLRAGSREEADVVAREAQSLGLAHSTVRWAGDKPATGLQAVARSARYRLLVEFAAAKGADAIMTAHTADDQAETVLMRMARASGLRGVAGMAEDSLIAAGASEPVRLLRPLLSLRRDELRAFLASAGARWIDDPSNDNVVFERVRVRKLLASLDAHGPLTAHALVECATAARCAVERLDALDDEAFRAADGQFDERGGARVGMRSDISAMLAARLIHAVGGADYAPNETNAGEALAGARGGGAATLGGVVLAARDGMLRLWREPAALLGRAGIDPATPIELAPGERVLWDGRFIVGNSFELTATLRPLGEASRALAESAREAEEWAAAPGLWIGGDLAAFPGGGGDLRPLAEERFLRRVTRHH